MLLTDHTIEKLAKLDKVANVYPRYEVFTNIQVGQYTAYTNLVGIPSEQLSAIALTDTSSPVSYTHLFMQMEIIM